MQRVTDQVDSGYLEQTPPRPLPPEVVLNLLGDYIFERPASAFLDPLLLIGIVALIGLVVLRTNTLFWFAPLLLIIVRIGLGAYYIWRRVWDDLLLLRKGLKLRAHVLRMRPHRNTTGEIDGALLDCAMVVAPRRTYVGSIWVSDGSEAARLTHQGRVEVICLPRTPGTWRIIEEVRSDVRYERVGPMQQIPQEA
ncbi:MAG TPA: hypothetical protein VGJ87_13940 [Roseiflexaceae bacterium]